MHGLYEGQASAWIRCDLFVDDNYAAVRKVGDVYFPVFYRNVGRADKSLVQTDGKRSYLSGFKAVFLFFSFGKSPDKGLGLSVTVEKQRIVGTALYGEIVAPGCSVGYTPYGDAAYHIGMFAEKREEFIHAGIPAF